MAYKAFVHPKTGNGVFLIVSSRRCVFSCQINWTPLQNRDLKKRLDEIREGLNFSKLTRALLSLEIR